MRIRHLHTIDLDEVEGRNLVHVNRMLQAAHHLMDSGCLPRAWHARDVHTPEWKQHLDCVCNVFVND